MTTVGQREIEMNPAGPQVVEQGPLIAAGPPARMPRRSLAARIAGRLGRLARSAVGLDSFLRNEDRRIFEQVVLPYFQADIACSHILFVGCDWYTKGYTRRFSNKNYWTLDIDPQMRKFAARHHIVDGLQNVSRHFAGGALDVIICNGVFGWGLDTPGDVDQAIRGCHDVLRPGGWLVLGVNGVSERRPSALETCRSVAAFEPAVFPPLGTANYLTETPWQHRFIFLRKPSGLRRGSDSVTPN